MNKIDVRTLYTDDGWGVWYDYNPMIEAFGNVAIKISDKGWQGDSRILYDNDGTLGYLIFGWGSCSGCDALQACEDLDDVQNLCDILQSRVKWFESKEGHLRISRLMIGKAITRGIRMKPKSSLRKSLNI